jgi:uncharacterized membrane protein
VIYGFFGWVYESIYYTVQFKKPVNTGFLHICFCPIYGFACVGNAIMFRNVDSPVAIFLCSMLVISALEYFVSWLLENLFSKRWWDYTNWPLNLNGRISLLSSLAFGAMSLLQMRFLQPSVENFVMRLSERAEYTTIFLFLIIIALDITVTVKDMDKENSKLWFVREELPALKRANENFSKKVRLLSDRYYDIRERIKEIIGK